MISTPTVVSDPVAIGEEEMTLNLYPDPINVESGIIEGIDPEVIDAKVPIETGAAKFPKASDISAVKMFTAIKSPTAL